MGMKIRELSKNLIIDRSFISPKKAKNMTNAEIMGRAIEQAISGPKIIKRKSPVNRFTEEQIKKTVDFFNKNFNSLYQK